MVENLEFLNPTIIIKETDEAREDNEYTNDQFTCNDSFVDESMIGKTQIAVETSENVKICKDILLNLQEKLLEKEIASLSQDQLEVEALKNKVNRLELKEERLNQEIEMLKDIVQENQQLREYHHRLCSNDSILQSKIGWLEQKIESKDEQIEKFRNEILILTLENKKQLEEKEMGNVQLQQTIQSKNEVIENLRNEISILNAEKEIAKQQGEDYFDELTDIRTHEITQKFTKSIKPTTTWGNPSEEYDQISAANNAMTIYKQNTPGSVARAAKRNVTARINKRINVSALVKTHGEVPMRDQCVFAKETDKNNLFRRLNGQLQNKILAMNKLIGNE